MLLNAGGDDPDIGILQLQNLKVQSEVGHVMISSPSKQLFQGRLRHPAENSAYQGIPSKPQFDLAKM